MVKGERKGEKKGERKKVNWLSVDRDFGKAEGWEIKWL